MEHVIQETKAAPTLAQVLPVSVFEHSGSFCLCPLCRCFGSLFSEKADPGPVPGLELGAQGQVGWGRPAGAWPLRPAVLGWNQWSGMLPPGGDG